MIPRISSSRTVFVWVEMIPVSSDMICCTSSSSCITRGTRASRTTRHTANTRLTCNYCETTSDPFACDTVLTIISSISENVKENHSLKIHAVPAGRSPICMSRTENWLNTAISSRLLVSRNSLRGSWDRKEPSGPWLFLLFPREVKHIFLCPPHLMYRGMLLADDWEAGSVVTLFLSFAAHELAS